MKTFGIRIILLFGGLFIAISSYSQCDCVPFPIAECGQLNVGFSPGGGVEFCENTEITFTNTSAPGFDYFVVKWENNAIDTVYNYNPISHIYVVPDSTLCLGDRGIKVCFKGIKTCANGSSCASGSYDFTLRVRPLAMFDANPQYCEDQAIFFDNTSCNGDSYFWNFGDGQTSTLENPSHTYSTPGNYTVTLTTTNNCGTDVFSDVIQVVSDPVAQVQLSTNSTTVCLGDVVGFTNITAPFGGVPIWQFPPVDSSQWMLTDTLMNQFSDFIEVLFMQEGTYTFRLRASNACSTDIETITITVLTAPTAAVNGSPPLCISNPQFDPSATYTNQGEINSYAWVFNGGTPGTSTVADPGIVTFATPGTHTVSLTINSDCGDRTVSTVIQVDPLPVIQLPSLPAQLCTGSDPIILSALPAGGDWSGLGIVNDTVFDPAIAGAGTHQLTYTAMNGMCTASESATIVVVNSAMVTAQDTQACIFDSPVMLIAAPAGGVWSGDGVLPGGFFETDSAGLFTPVYSYTDINGCSIQVSPDIVIQALPVSMMTDTTVLCNENIDNTLANVLSLNLSPGGGDTLWMFNGLPSNGIVNGMGLTGFYPVGLMYSYESCEIADSAIIEFVSATPLVISGDTVICINQMILQLQANLPGIWSGPGVDPLTGTINLSAAGGGTHVYAFEHQPGTSCEQRDTLQVIINDPGVNLSAGADVSLCYGEASTHVFNTGTPLGGTWSGWGVTDPVAGILDLTLLNPDTTYSYQYCVEVAALPGCMACDALDAVVHSLPDPGFSIFGFPCKDEVFSVGVDSCESGTTYTWWFGDGNTATGCFVDYIYSNAGDYNLQLHAVSTFGCDSALQQAIHVTEPAVAAFDLLSKEGCAPFLVQVTDLSSGEINNQEWIIGGDTITGSTPGIYNIDHLLADSLVPIILEVTNGCAVVKAVDSVLVHPYPVVDFGFSVDEGCSPLYIEFGNATLGNPETWLWDLGNTITSVDSIPSPQYYTTPSDSVSMYTVTLISTNACGADTMQQTITVYPPDVTAFIQLDTIAGCQPLQVPAHSLSTPGSVIGWQVIGPDGQVTGSTDPDPVFVLDQPGIHTVILSAGRCGMDFDTAYIEVYPAPVLDFLIDTVICEDEVIEFDNHSLDVTGTFWDLGDGTQSTDFNPLHQYNNGGQYWVTLSANSVLHNCPDTLRELLTVHSKPVLNIDSMPRSGCPPYSIQFQNLGPGGIHYVWLYHDGTPLDTVYAPVHIFNQTGTFIVEAFAYDASGCFSDTVNIPVDIFPLPLSSFELNADQFCERYDSVLAENLSQGANSYYWLINGQSTGTDPLEFLPDTQGVYDIALVSENSFGCRDTSRSEIQVLDSPDATFGLSDMQGCAPLAIQIDNQSVDATNYVWNFGEGNTSIDFEPEHIFRDSGVFTIRLIALNTNGCPNDTAQASIVVHPLPDADFGFQKQTVCGTPMEVMFTNHSIGGLDYQWTFGDGAISDELDPVHLYTQDGFFDVSLEVRNLFDCRDTAFAEIPVYLQPIADFMLTGNAFCEEEPVEILNTSINANTYCWFLDDVLFSETEDAFLIFPEAGQYEISLVAKYNAYCTDTFQDGGTILVYTTPQAGFSYEINPTPNILGDVQFYNQSVDFDRLKWDFGDSTFTQEADPFHEYDINRDIQVVLYAYNDNSGNLTCIDTFIQDIAPEWLVTFFAPNAFSPEYGDTLVRLFKPVGVGLEEYTIEVYSPWGQKVWQSTKLMEHHPVEAWNGRLNNTGEILPQGAFSWIAQVLFVNGERRVYNGSVTLLR